MAKDQFGVEGELFGYNHENIAKIHDRVNEVAKNTVSSIETVIENDIVIPMSTVWYAPEAQDFFNNLKITVAGVAETLTKAFNDFIANVNSAEEAWAKKTSSETYGMGAMTTVQPIDPLEITIDIKAIKDQDRGNVSLHKARALNIANNDLATVQTNLEKDIAKQKGELESVNQAFLGGGQGAAVESCFETVLEAIGHIFDFLTKGENNLQGQIIAAADTYVKMAESVATEFTKQA